MAHHVYFYFPASTDLPEQDVEKMLSALSTGGHRAEAVGWHSSADWQGDNETNWVAVDLHEGGASAGLSVEVHIKDAISAGAWEAIAHLPGAPAEDDATGLCIVTMSGPTRWDLFETLQGYWKVDRRAVERDEVSGFEGMRP